MWMRDKLVQTKRNYDCIQQQIDADEPNSNTNSFLKSAQKNDREDGNQRQGHTDLVFQYCGRERILNDVSGGVGGGKRDRDNEIRSHESKQYEYKELALPPRKQMLQHRD